MTNPITIILSAIAVIVLAMLASIEDNKSIKFELVVALIIWVFLLVMFILNSFVN